MPIPRVTEVQEQMPWILPQLDGLKQKLKTSSELEDAVLKDDCSLRADTSDVSRTPLNWTNTWSLRGSVFKYPTPPHGVLNDRIHYITPTH